MQMRYIVRVERTECAAVMSHCPREEKIPPFTTEFMLQEWAWHKEWFLEKLLGLKLGEHEKVLDECTR